MPTCPKLALHRLFYTVAGVVIMLCLLYATAEMFTVPLPPTYGTDD